MLLTKQWARVSGKNGSLHYNCFASQVLNYSQRNYSKIDKELFEIIWPTRKFKHYLYGSKFVLKTDHNPLTRLKEMSDIRGRRASIVAESLSRSINTVEILPDICVKEEQRKDPEILEAIKAILGLQSEETIKTTPYMSQLMKSKKFLQRGILPVIQCSLKEPILSMVHDNILCHMGINKCIESGTDYSSRDFLSYGKDFVGLLPFSFREHIHHCVCRSLFQVDRGRSCAKSLFQGLESLVRHTPIKYHHSSRLSFRTSGITAESKNRTTAYRPMYNGLEILRSLIKDDPQTRDDFIDNAILSLRAKPSRKEMKSYYDRNAKRKFYNIGDYVLINIVARGKLDPLFDGPFKNIEKNHPLVYDVEHIYIQNERITAHFNKFVPCASPESRSMQDDVSPARPTRRRSQRITAQNNIPDYSMLFWVRGKICSIRHAC
ncbi:hypothetical protein RF11_12610 [Thelohanellus kitauei]|uniref:Reverse transcriptase RNase H-like domain-containing protein n=1 Tax=Thelohanellus kitauei TaxID=669202 RepID=A0A0C2IQM2_THEKT|nr:hypothetical protein RF11_12610 [Thelohanellus kitauei]